MGAQILRTGRSSCRRMRKGTPARGLSLRDGEAFAPSSILSRLCPRNAPKALALPKGAWPCLVNAGVRCADLVWPPSRNPRRLRQWRGGRSLSPLIDQPQRTVM